MSFLEGDEKEGSRPSQVFGSVQIEPQGPHGTQGPVFFELTMIVRAGIVTGDTLCEPSLASWFLAIKSKEGNKATFSHWPRLDTCLQPRHGFRCACQRPKLARKQFWK